MASAEVLQKFDDEGCVVIENFLSDEEADMLRSECYDLVEKMNPSDHHTVFSTSQQSYRDKYFINSRDKIGYFFEAGALDDKGSLIVDKHKSLNKIGHALHVFCPNFRKVTFSEKVKNLIRQLEFKDPVVPQSMYIFKQPGIGGEVTPHQDASFLYTEPQALMGMWIALEDATLDNGCLWYIPGSHKQGLHSDYRMVLNPENEGSTCIFEGTAAKYNAEDYIPAPVKKGSLVLINGLVVHKSEPNTSMNSRHIYTFHLYDAAVGKWSGKNWLQPTEANTFTHMYEVE